MRRTLEAIFRHPIQLLVLLILPLALGLVGAFLQPRMYKDTASLWANQRYETITDSGSQTDISVPPAQTQATALQELLQTRTFALDIANQTSLATQLDSSAQADPELRDDALLNEIGKVQVEAASYNLFVISYQNKDPRIAQQVVQAVIKEYAQQSSAFSVAEANRLIAIYQSELDEAQKEVDKRVAAAAKYLHDYPTADPRTDPQYLQLQAQTDQANNQASTLSNQIATLQLAISTQGGSTDGLFTVVDQPTIRTHPESRVKTLAMFGGAGLLVGLVFAAGYVLLLVRRGRTVISQPEDVQRVAAHAVLLHMPMLDASSVLLAEPTRAADASRAKNNGKSGRN